MAPFPRSQEAVRNGVVAWEAIGWVPPCLTGGQEGGGDRSPPEVSQHPCKGGQACVGDKRPREVSPHKPPPLQRGSGVCWRQTPREGLPAQFPPLCKGGVSDCRRPIATEGLPAQFPPDPKGVSDCRRPIAREGLSAQFPPIQRGSATVGDPSPGRVSPHSFPRCKGGQRL